MKKTIYTRDVILIMIAAFFYMSCNNSVSPLVAGYAEKIGASGIWMGMISAVVTAAAVAIMRIILWQRLLTLSSRAFSTTLNILANPLRLWSVELTVLKRL